MTQSPRAELLRLSVCALRLIFRFPKIIQTHSETTLLHKSRTCSIQLMAMLNARTRFVTKITPVVRSIWGAWYKSPAHV